MSKQQWKPHCFATREIVLIWCKSPIRTIPAAELFLETFYRMRLVEDRAYFKDSWFRKIAKEVLSIEYYPLDDWEKEQLESLKKYAKTGMTEENRD